MKKDTTVQDKKKQLEGGQACILVLRYGLESSGKGLEYSIVFGMVRFWTG